MRIMPIDPVNLTTINQFTASLNSQQIRFSKSQIDIGQETQADANSDAVGGSKTIMGIGLEMDLYC